eukprot:TRINITY_DN1384_c0_g2_i1.p1 TRINITY_DN1384_c0_g2~~TRINITY_DN1384_c0_g2_i1.p1  ORF type:complete len:1061 (+),score=365.46 TRINITY_DN1384_c0_g2_i1:571-3753(+)
MSKINPIAAINAVGLNDSHYFETGTAKLEEVRKLLDQSANKDKLEGMKRLIALMTKGVDVSSFFPDVVKNVVVSNPEVKKLVYMYLVNYAEHQPELALLSINNFQKDMSDQNQLIRAVALRVMSSIKVSVIVGLQILAVKKCAADMSPYVRKTAAHALPKIYRLGPDRKEELVDCIESLLKDKSTMVLGSVIAAYNEICPERYDLLHQHYRKLCHLLADIDEWGQILLLGILTKYARTQFLDPNEPVVKKDKVKKDRSDDDSGYDSDDDSSSSSFIVDDTPGSLLAMDSDHRLLLKAAQPLLNSRNAGVVLAVASVFYYLSPPYESTRIGKALTRLIRGSREVEYVVLANITTMAVTRSDMFDPYVKDFFVTPSDSEHCRPLKLEILTLLAKESNIGQILKEFKEYVKSSDEEFVTATIQAIGRCASTVPEVAESCLHGLMGLLSSKQENVVAESVVVIKTLLQNNPAHHKSFVSQVVKILDKIRVPAARGSIVWMIGEYCELIPQVAPDTLRLLAKSFGEEDEFVKLQVLTMAAKVMLRNPTQTALLFQYVLDLAKYDQSYDVRDRARLLRAVLLDGQSKMPSVFAKANDIFFHSKPAPVLGNPSADRQRFALGSLSHLVNHSVEFYDPIPDWTTEKPDGSVRVPPTPPKSETDSRFSSALGGSGSGRSGSKARRGSGDSMGGFYSDEDTYSDDYSNYSYSDSYSGYSDSYSGYSSYSYSDDDDAGKPPHIAAPHVHKHHQQQPATPHATPVAGQSAGAAAGGGGGKDLLNLEALFGAAGVAPAAATSAAPSTGTGSAADPTAAPATSTESSGGIAVRPAEPALAHFETPKRQLLNHTNGSGLQIDYSFTRQDSMFGPENSVVRLYLSNKLSEVPINAITISAKGLDEGRSMQPFAGVATIAAQHTEVVNIHVNFNLKMNPVKLEIVCDRGNYTQNLEPLAGELLRPIMVSPEDYSKKEKELSGMHEMTSTAKLYAPASEVAGNLTPLILRTMNGLLVSSDDTTFRYAGSAGKSVCLLTLTITDPAAKELGLKINCDNPVFSSSLSQAIKEALKKKPAN